MAIEVSSYDIIYGRLLTLNFTTEQAKTMAKTLYQLSKDLDISVGELLKYVNSTGLRFENEIYSALNQSRTNSSQIGYLDKSNIAAQIKQQVPVYNVSGTAA
jgi:hypothetical protein